mmetsp:Transcript_33979/g.79998  ORF Transcript_33979/g.79998 Transcript_33979/m.79998 type:complete len:585 (-) Transcript_33979:430-2184(-)|eukprot:CAMPEP_0172388564 /NCGR_PEP_ID=MMETSP1061-20121228/5635_1 /TAXON_ID=37318 /ORGANISM="Pseudo-nitzschia pungens, Strain cf. pungens" /LENGTH=584 /DNA_ID=CAMNT_0013118485 /DNA_START=168 /DNA_END=1922 /DNA_ORIENTATION=-
MSTPLNFKGYSSPNGGGGAYGAHSSGTSNNSTRQRRNPADYGPFSSPHASFDDPVPFPPYAELPFTSLKRRRQLQENKSVVKWAMRAVLLSPVVVLLLWSVGAAMFASSPHHQVRQNGNSNSSGRQQSRRNKRMLPNYYGNNQPVQQSPVVYLAGSAPLQDQQGNLIYNVNGNAMMMTPQQLQQLQLQGVSMGQSTTNQFVMPSVQQQQGILQKQQSNQLPVVAPLGNGMDITNVQTPNNIHQGQQQIVQQQMQQQVQQQVQQQSAFAAPMGVAQPQQLFMMSTDQVGEVSSQNFNTIQQQQQQMPQANHESADVAVKQQVMTSSASGEQQRIAHQSIDNGTVQSAANMQQQQQQQQQQPLGQTSIAGDTQASDAMQQNSDSSFKTQVQNQLEASPSKQAVYFYNPKDTRMSETGEILQMPTVVYDLNGKAMPLSELQYQAPIYVQPPLRGASTTGTVSNETTETGRSSAELVSPTARGASLVTPSSREASIAMPESWGSSTSQDQTIIVATVAVMALLVGALSARRLRSRSFLSACIENESLEDDVAYDDAYTTTAAASGAMGGDSSYNTFGGWKGDLEKFDV